MQLGIDSKILNFQYSMAGMLHHNTQFGVFTLNENVFDKEFSLKYDSSGITFGVKNEMFLFFSFLISNIVFHCIISCMY